MSIATRIEAIEEHIGDLYNTLELGGADLTNVNKNIENISGQLKDRYLDYMNNGTEQIWNNWDKVTGQGTDITLNNTIEAPMKLTPQGNSEQKTTKGNQLVDFSNMYKTNNTTVTFINDVLTISSTGKSRWAQTDITNLYKANAGKTLKFVYDNIDITNQYGTRVVYLVVTENGTDNLYNLLNHSLENTTHTIPNDVSNVTQVIFRITSNGFSSTDYNATTIITKLMLQFGTEDKQYEEYTGGQPSPNPNYEQPVNSVGDNVNLFDKNTSNILNAYLSSSTITAGSGQRTIYIPITGGKTYTISKILSTRFKVGTTADVPTVGDTCIDYISNDSSDIITINTSSSANYLCAFVYNPNSDTLTEQQILDSIKIEENPQATPYSPYGMGCASIEKTNIDNTQSKTYIISTQQPMRSIGNVRDDFVKQAGVWYERHKIARKVFDGTENWQYNSNSTRPFYLAITNIVKPANNNTIPALFSNEYISYAWNTSVANVNYAMSMTASEDYLRIRNTNFTSVADFKADLATKYANGTPVYVDYVKTEPILLPCTNEQTAVLEAMQTDKSYTEQTNIYSTDTILPYMEAVALKNI